MSKFSASGGVLALSAMLTTGSFLVAPSASATLIYAGNPVVAGGVGNSQVVLSLSSPGSTSNETGAITPIGCTGDTQPPCSSPSNSLRTFSSAGISNAQNLVVYLDAQEPGNDNLITLNALTLNVYAASGTGTTPLFAAPYGGITPFNLTTCPGQGNNCVNAFVLDTTAAAQLQGIFAPSLRVGLSASFSNATGGPDRLFLASRNDVPEPPPIPAIPEPSSLALLGAGLAGLGWLRARRRTRVNPGV